jgi:N-acetylmuramoyl-L-alanine amidase
MIQRSGIHSFGSWIAAYDQRHTMRSKGKGTMTVQSRHYALILSAVAMLLGISFVESGAVSAAGKGTKTSVSCPVLGGAHVVLDPGHGGSDSGAVNSTYGLAEKEVTLDIALRAQAILKNAGYSVALTRYDNDTTLENSVRGSIANACGAAVFVEIHLNASSDASVDYTQTYWGKKGKDLSFSQTMDQALLGLVPSSPHVGQFANGGLLTATMPSTLAETVFITNDSEGQRLSDGSGTRQNEIASALASGIETWMAPQ